MPNKSVLLLMSGGVDSCTSAAILKEQGYHVIGLTYKLLEPNPEDVQVGQASNYIDVRDVKRVAQKVGIEHYVKNISHTFREMIISSFVQNYKDGLTPNPCVHCNRHIKFKQAYEFAQQFGCDYIATGHYARVDYDQSHNPILKRALFREKDQSYFLFGVSPEYLKRTIFPLGDKTKPQVRDLAQNYRLEISEKTDSQEICFTEGNDYTSFLENHVQFEPGKIYDTSGNELGPHKGIVHYTIGQRKGLGLTGGPYYVCHIDASRNAIIVGRKEDLGKKEVTAHSPNWITPPRVGDKVFAQIRSRHTPAEAIITQLDINQLTVQFSDHQHGIAPGQALVVSRDDQILGGGIITA